MTEEKATTMKSPDEDGFAYIDNGTGIEEETEPDYTEGEPSITEPFDPTLIRIETRTMTIDLVLTRIKEGELDLEPTFQRKSSIWKPQEQSRLIESLLIRIPLPAFYMDATDDERWLVVDGQQRLTTMKEFVLDGKLKLYSLEFLKDLEGKIYKELPRNLQRRILETQVTVYVIVKGTPPEVKFNIFKRINTGGLPLSSQEIRHALNQGPASELLARLAESNEFQAATNNTSMKDDRMEQREFILRFLAFMISSYMQYKTENLEIFLNEQMAKINKMSREQIQDIETKFKRTMIAAYDIFGKYAFRKRYKDSSRMSPINKALFEVWSVSLNQLSDEQLQLLKERKEEVNRKFIELMKDTEFNKAVSQATGQIKNVQRRFSAIEQLIQEVLL
ncbi:MAG: DUF262 domain-containing protein [Oscillatoriaceae cyanobacterium]